MNHRLHSSKTLFEHPLKPHEPGFDKVFLLGRVLQDMHKRFRIVIEEKTPTVALNDAARVSLGLNASIPTVKDIQTRKSQTPYSLISVGMHLWIRSTESGSLQSVLLQRDLQSDSPGQWTEPSGRCDRPILRSMHNEAQEELLVLFRKAGEKYLKPVVIINSPEDVDVALAFKKAQIPLKVAALAKLNIVATDIDTDSAVVARTCELPHEKGLYQPVIVTLGNKKLMPFLAMPLWDAANNTLEIRRSAVIDADPDDDIMAIDGEPYNRKIGSKSTQQITHMRQQDCLRPGLALYIDAVNATIPRLEKR